jgi:hypothetical protein
VIVAEGKIYNFNYFAKEVARGFEKYYQKPTFYRCIL